MDIETYRRAMEDLDLPCACLTNHGDMSDYLRMAAVARPGTSLIPGVEISSPRGDFLIFSSDLDFLAALAPAQALPSRDDLPGRTAVVWAHPFAGIAGGLPPDDEHVRDVAASVDAIEVYNGNWPDPAASVRNLEIAASYSLAEVGGSDSHNPQQLLCCWTEFPGGCRQAALIEAILARETRAVIPSRC